MKKTILALGTLVVSMVLTQSVLAETSSYESLLNKAKVSREEAKQIADNLYANWDSLTAQKREELRSLQNQKMNESTDLTTCAVDVVLTGQSKCQ